jgi:hypothetical protein
MIMNRMTMMITTRLKLSELEEVPNEQVTIWLDGLSSGREITSSFDFIAENKGNIEMLVDMRGVVSV